LVSSIAAERKSRLLEVEGWSVQEAFHGFSVLDELAAVGYREIFRTMVKVIFGFLTPGSHDDQSGTTSVSATAL
jgi:hypothetical protein